MLLGRAVEQARITTLLDGAAAGHSAALVIRGEAGIGKSALLDEAAARSGFQVLRARGVESESEIGYSGLHDLLAPIVDARSELPDPQAAAIGAAMSVGPQVPVEPLAICAGLLGLLSIASRRDPVLVVIDDAHLLDRASADAMGFAARRLRDDRVAVLLTIREGEASALATDGIPEMRLEPLDDDSAAALLGRRRRAVAGDASLAILALARGNPLAILELPPVAELDPGSPAATEAITAGGLLSRAFGGRIERLPASTRTALVVASASDDDDLRMVLTACRLLSIEPEAL